MPRNSLAPYFLDTNLQSYTLATSADYQATTAAISETSCHQVGLANLIFAEYPLWPALKEAGWHGDIQNVNVQNVTRRYEDPAFEPCILLRQVTAGYVGADASKVHLQFGSLALAVDPRFAGSLDSQIDGFHSSVPNVRIQPGGGWSLGGSGQPTLVNSGSIFLSSPVRQTVTLQLRSSSSTNPAHLVASATSAALRPTLLSSAAAVSLDIPPGITEVRVDPIDDRGGTKVTGIDVGPASTT